MICFIDEMLGGVRQFYYEEIIYRRSAIGGVPLAPSLIYIIILMAKIFKSNLGIILHKNTFPLLEML